MSDNTITTRDSDNDFPDWIELYNNGNSPIDLKNYYLSDDLRNLNKWSFPEVIVEPNNYILVFASGKDKLDQNELHTNFKISSEGEAIYLTDISGTIIDQTDKVHLSSKETYGRLPDGSSNWIRNNNATPGYSNITENQLIFSNNEGFYSTPFYLKINSPLNDTIRYTLNGSLPTKYSSIFRDSLLIENRSSLPNIFSIIPTTPAQNLIAYKAWEPPRSNLDKLSILRCASFNNGKKISDIYSKTFFVGEGIFKKYSMPIISLMTDSNNLFNLDSGIFVPGIHYNPTNPEFSGNYFMKGTNWEKPVHIEFFENDGTLGFSQNSGIRIHGGKTRHASQKSLRMYARTEYGKKNFKYPLIPSKKTKKYKRFVLRTSMASWSAQTIFQTTLAQEITKPLDIDNQDFQPVIVFINGEYWGIHTLNDRIDENYIEYTHNLPKDSVEFKNGTNSNYNNLIDFITLNDLSYANNYEYVKTQIDINNYIDYKISELFFKNYDWPANNMKLWRPLSNGKWRWVFYDIDAGFDDYRYNMLMHATANNNLISWPNSPSSTLLFRSFLKNQSFKNSFINRYAEILNTTFSPSKMLEKLDSIKTIYSPELSKHIERWNYPESYSKWENDIHNNLQLFIENRSCSVEKNLTTFFHLDEFDFSCNIDQTNYSNNKIILAPNPSNGSFFLYNNYLFDIVNAKMTIRSMNGAIITTQNNISISSKEKKYFHLSNLASNTYILHIESSEINLRLKLVIIN